MVLVAIAVVALAFVLVYMFYMLYCLILLRVVAVVHRVGCCICYESCCWTSCHSHHQIQTLPPLAEEEILKQILGFVVEKVFLSIDRACLVWNVRPTKPLVKDEHFQNQC